MTGVKEIKIERTFNNRVDPLRYFITGCKSHLTKSVSSCLVQTFSFHSASPGSPKILLLTPTSTINIDNTTINTAQFFGKSSRYGKIRIAMWLFGS